MHRVLSSLLLMAILGSCAASIPKSALRLQESTLDVRSIQTRILAAPSEIDILTATIAVLQDMEFNVDRIEKPLGVITASKVTDVDSFGEKVGLFFLDMLCNVGSSSGCNNSSSAKDEQHITLTMVVLPSLARSDEYAVRITLQRVIYDQINRIKVLERIDDAETYQQIFDNLRKSLYLQVGEI
jgi:hypothetical protein